jgi:hypothetical protein
MKGFFMLSIPTLAALLLATTARASPHGNPQALAVRELSTTRSCHDIGYGANSIVSGKVCASFEGNNMKV